MNIEYLTQLLTNRLNALNLAKEQAFLSGDLETINKLNGELDEVVNTINKLKLLASISQTAAVTPFTEAEVVQNGIEVSFGVAGSNIISAGQSADCLREYDISSYATDPAHEANVAAILGRMSKLISVSDIDLYISGRVSDSPVTGEMVFQAAKETNVDIRLLLAIMEQDSRFGTEGVAVRTMNPGNVGNTGSAEQSFASWQEGVYAVAHWLNTHRAVAAGSEAQVLNS